MLVYLYLNCTMICSVTRVTKTQLNHQTYTVYITSNEVVSVMVEWKGEINYWIITQIEVA